MSFRSPELLWLLSLAPFALALALWLWRRRLQASADWVSRGLWPRLLPGLRRWRLWLQITALATSVLAVALALARPTRGESGEPRAGRDLATDLVLVVDTSASMRARDARPDRLTVARLLARRLLDRSAVERVALIQVEGTATVLSPLTADHDAVSLLVDTLEAGSGPVPGTDLAAGLHQAAAVVEDADDGPSAVLLTDGENHGGDAAVAAADAAQRGLIVHAIGIGREAGAQIPLPGGGVKTDRSGRRVLTRLDSERLERIAAAGQGSALMTTRPGIDLERLGLDSTSRSRQISSPAPDDGHRFQVFLALAVGSLLLVLGIHPFEAS